MGDEPPMARPKRCGDGVKSQELTNEKLLATNVWQGEVKANKEREATGKTAQTRAVERRQEGEDYNKKEIRVQQAHIL